MKEQFKYFCLLLKILKEEDGNLCATCSINLPYQSSKEQIYFSLYNQKDQEVKKEEEGAVLGEKMHNSIKVTGALHITQAENLGWIFIENFLIKHVTSEL